MRSIWRRLQSAPRWIRWPAKWAIFALVFFLVLYPYPGLFVRHVAHVRVLNTLPDPAEPSLTPLSGRFDAFLADTGVGEDDPAALLAALEDFVSREIPYRFDWELWGVADYLPTLAEVLAAGTEDCDGRAVVAAALLRSRGIEAELVGGTAHVWVRTPMGETMGPLGEPVLTADRQGTHVRWRRLLDIAPLAIGVSLFPFGRELIILLTVWMLLLPPVVGWKRAGIALVVLLEGLVVMRLAGTPARAPSLVGAWWGLLHLPLAGSLLEGNRWKSGRHTGRSVV